VLGGEAETYSFIKDTLPSFKNVKSEEYASFQTVFPDTIDLSTVVAPSDKFDVLEYQNWLASVKALALKYKNIFLFCDGSARFVQTECLSASSGLFIIPHTNGTLGEAYGLSLSCAGGIAGTPFDAELLAGVSACTIACSIAEV
jgi:hypothetical protein